MSDAQWYYAVGGHQRGPVPLATLQQMASSGTLHPHDLVWTEGMANWQAAGSTEGLSSAFAPRPGYPPHYPAATSPPGGGPSLGYYTGQTLHAHFAGFWIRFCGAIIDGLIVLAVTKTMEAGIRSIFHLDPTPFVPRPGPPGTEAIVGLMVFVLEVVFGWLYYALQESSSYQATLGKRAIGVQVVGLDGQRISFARATGRYFAEMLSALTLMIGYMMAGWTQRKQALHDIIAGTYVIYKS